MLFGIKDARSTRRFWMCLCRPIGCPKSSLYKENQRGDWIVQWRALMEHTHTLLAIPRVGPWTHSIINAEDDYFFATVVFDRWKP